MMSAVFVLSLAVTTEASAANCTRQPSRCDSDADGLNNQVEAGLGTNAYDADTDDDGLGDGAEVQVHHTDPLLADTDGDGLEDDVELLVTGTDPRLADTDGDGSDDADDLYPLDPLEWADTDGDGLPDGADPDDDGDGADDAAEVHGGPALASLVPGLADLLVCDGDFGPVPNAACVPYAVQLDPGGVALGVPTGEVGEWLEGVAADGGRTLLLGFPSATLASQRVNGVQVAPGSATACYEGFVETLGGSSGGATWWDTTGRFSLCLP